MLRIGGYQGLSAIDYPGRVCAVVFTQGCDMTPPCPYCHNPSLIPETGEVALSEGEVLEELSRRRDALQCVTVTGGEPTLHGDRLIAFLNRLRSTGYQVKLDTNGTHRDVLRAALERELVHYVALDYKGGVEFYGSREALDSVLRCMDDLQELRVPCEVRTTCDGRTMDEGTLFDMALEVRKRRLKWYLQDAGPPGRPFADMELLLDLARQRTDTVWRR